MLFDKYISGPPGRRQWDSRLIHLRPRGKATPLSFAQEQVWESGKAASATPFHNETVTVYRHGPLDVRVLERCLLEIVRRHEIWRTTFGEEGDRPVQIVHPAPERFPLRVFDLGALPEAEQGPEAVRLAEHDAAAPFDLRNGPLLRGLLIDLNGQEHRLYLTLHQLVFDAVSAHQIFLPELTALYNAFWAGVPSPLPEPRIQYADFAYFQRDTDSPDSRPEAMAYWRGRLRGELPASEWPSDHARPPIESHRGSLERFALPRSLAWSIRTASQRAGVTVYETFLAGIAALLHRCTGQGDVVIGGVSAGRGRAEIEETLGCFVNSLAFRIDVSGNPTFAELQWRAHQVIVNALAYDDVPFAHVVREMQARPDPSRHPLFQIILSARPESRRVSPGWEIATGEISNCGSKLDLFIVIDDKCDDISASITYNTDLFDRSTICRFVANWQTLLAAASINPEMRIADLPILAIEERRQVLVDWNETTEDFPQRTLQEWFELQAEKSPDARALTFEGAHLSYGELNRRANQVAHYLRRLGAGPEVLVGLFLERSLEMVIGLLGVLKAGGAYVPIDPEYPPDRVAFMLEDAAAPILLVQGRLRDSLPQYKGRVVCLDEDWDRISREEVSNPARQATPGNLAYVIYTSGSTGTPKGVMNTHRGISNRLLWGQNRFRLTTDDKVLQKTPFSFDVSVWEFFWPLLAGAQLVLAKPGGHRDPDYLVSLITQEEITVSHFVPAMLGVLLAHPGVERCRSLRLVLCSGEALPFNLQEQFFKLLPAELHNLYGPTEAGVEVSHWACERTSARNIVPIGRPIANTQAYILDSELRPLPIGVPGELYIGGIQVARGYHHRPDLTAERFIADPFSSDRAARLYKTGDTCRWLPDGAIEFLGRMDLQVKIWGCRVEIGEIEAALCGHSGVVNAAVVARDDGAGGKYLVACVVARDKGSLGVEELRELLQQKLPSYMLPSRLIFLERLPLLANGKVNRKALALGDPPDGQRGRTYVAPSDEIERRLTKLWESLLGTPSIGIHDDFFELGGYSLLASLLLAGIQREFDIKLPLSTVFQAPTIEVLARLIRSRYRQVLRLVEPEDSTQRSSLVPIQPEGSRPPVFCISGVGGDVFVFRVLARYLKADQPIFGLQPPEPGRKQPALMSVPDIARHYVREIRARQPGGPYFVAGFSFGGMVAFEIACQLHAQGQQIALLVLFDSDLRTPMNELPVPARAQNRWNVYRLYWHRVVYGPERASYLKGTIRGKSAKLIYRMYSALGRRVPPAVAAFGTILDIQTFAANNYVPGIYPGRVTLFRCRVRPAEEKLGYDLGWRKVTGGGLEIHDVPGDHHSMWAEPHVRVVVTELQSCLEQARLHSLAESQVR